jgi:hypothetical protein
MRRDRTSLVRSLFVSLMSDAVRALVNTAIRDDGGPDQERRDE